MAIPPSCDALKTLTNNEQLKLQDFRNKIYKSCILKINNSWADN